MKNFNSEIVVRKSEDKLIFLFNKRDEKSYEYVYNLFYDELYYFASRLYVRTEVVPADVIQDVFLSIWGNKDTKFQSIENIKNYLFLSLRNRYIKYWEHKKHVDKYAYSISNDSDYFTSEMIEVEVISKLSLMINTLPSECAKVFRLYLEGYDTKDIADKLGKAPSTIYNQRKEAISIIRKKFPNELLMVALYLLSK